MKKIILMLVIAFSTIASAQVVEIVSITKISIPATMKDNRVAAIGTDGSLLAFCGGAHMLVYQVSYNGDVPSLTLLYKIPNIRTASGVAFDVANNLYFVSSASQYLEVYALPRNDCSYTTKALGENDVVTVVKSSSLVLPHAESKVHKVIRNNQVYIIRNGEYYNTLGTKVK